MKVKEMLTKAKKSKIVKESKKGHDFGKRGKNFKKVGKEGEEEYGSKSAGKRVAGAAFWNKFKHR